MRLPAERALVVGLGNPGSRYLHTRHNVGFKICDQLLEQLRAAGARGSWGEEREFNAQVASLECTVSELVGTEWIGDKAANPTSLPDRMKIWLVKPQTFMNRSGESVRRLADFFKVGVEQIVAIHDEIDLPFGRLRLKAGGGAGGHNGIRSLIEHLGSSEFLRLRFGVDRPPSAQMSTLGVETREQGSDPRHQEISEWVLSRFTPPEERELPSLIERAVAALRDTLVWGLKVAQQKYN